MNDVIVLGDGLLGTEFVKQTGWDFISRKKDNFDITDKDNYYKFFIDNFNEIAFWSKYKIIVNCIANTNTYSTDKESHWNVNYKSVINLANFCEENNIKLVHISTDYVYTNSISEAGEDDVPIHGNNWYSYTKLLGDSYVQLNKNNLVLRGTHKKYPFPYKEAWVDQVGNFDYVSKIAELMICLIKDNACGVYNIGTELKTMFELAIQSNKVKPIFKPFLAPSNTSMNTNKLQNALKRINQ